MKLKRALLLLLVPLLLVSCATEHQFLRDEDGYGYTDKKTDVHYLIQESVFEAARGEAVVGVYEDKKTGLTRTFRKIPGMDPALFLADDDKNVYYAGDTPLAPELWTLTAAIICEERAFSAEQGRLTASENGAALADLHTLWFEGDGNAELPLDTPCVMRRIKLVSTEYPNLYYCFDFLLFQNGEAYFYDRFLPRTVAVPAELSQKIYREEAPS